MTEQLKIVKQTIYVANDGKEFTSKNECQEYEDIEQLKKDNGVVYLVHNVKRMKRYGYTEAYSTYELAVESLQNVEPESIPDYKIDEVIVDYRTSIFKG